MTIVLGSYRPFQTHPHGLGWLTTLDLIIPLARFIPEQDQDANGGTLDFLLTNVRQPSFQKSVPITFKKKPGFVRRIISVKRSC